MSRADIDDIRARYETVSAGDRGAIFRDVHPGFTLQTPDRVPNAGVYLGAEEANRFMQDFWAPFEEIIIEPQESFDNGDQVVMLLQVRSRHKGSDAFVEINVGALWTMRDGKPIRCQMFPQAEEALQAAGISRPA